MPYKILLVDDEQIIRDGLEKAIDWNEIGFSISGKVSDGMRALDFLKDNPVDVVFTDIRMPVMSGLELSRSISEHYPSLKVMILSGYGDFEYAQEAFKYGVFGYILKPSKEEELISEFGRLKKFLDNERQTGSAGINNVALLYEKAIISLIIKDEKRFEHSEYEIITDGFFNKKENMTACILIIAIDNYNDNLTTLSQCRWSVDEATKEIIDSDENFITFSISPDEICVLYFADSEEESGILGNKLYEAIQSNMSKLESISASYALSNVLRSRMELQDAFYSVKELIKHRFYMGHGKLLTNRQIQLERDIAEISFGEICSRLVNAILTQDKEAIESDIDAIFSYFVQSRVTDLEKVISFIYKLLYIIENDFAKLVVDIARHFSDKEEIIKLMRGKNDLKGIRDILADKINRLAQAMDDKESSLPRRLVRSAVEIIDKEYYHDSLSLQSIADRLNLSSAYLSRLFKREMKITLMQYLTDVRISHAKIHLGDISYKIYEIAEKVGYSDQRYFSEVFRSRTGLTPMEYRERIRN